MFLETPWSRVDLSRVLPWKVLLETGFCDLNLSLWCSNRFVEVLLFDKFDIRNFRLNFICKNVATYFCSKVCFNPHPILVGSLFFVNLPWHQKRSLLSWLTLALINYNNDRCVHGCVKYSIYCCLSLDARVLRSVFCRRVDFINDNLGDGWRQTSNGAPSDARTPQNPVGLRNKYTKSIHV